MTGHSDGSGETGNLHLRNRQIRDYCIANNKILYDFYDIECYDPDGNYFGDKFVKDNCDYDSNGDGSRDGNWAKEWQNSHTEGVDWYQCSSAHSQPLNANQKAYAAWWLWARLAGWNGRTFTIELTDFNANISDSTVIINWNTEKEINSYGFYIERLAKSDSSVTPENGLWETIGFIEAQGNSNSLKKYSFVDKPDTLIKSYFYRLKLVCIDGTFKYSNVIEVNFNYTNIERLNKKELIRYNLYQNYPNPFNPTTTISYSIPKITHPHQNIGGQALIPSREGKEQSGRGVLIKLKVYDILGKEVATLVNQKQIPGNYKVTFDAKNLPSGIYFYRIKINNFVETKRMILLR